MNPGLKKLRSMLEKELETLRGNRNIKDRRPSDILLGVLFDDGHTHFVFPPEWAMDDLFQGLERESGKKIPMTETIPISEKPKIPRRIVFHNRQAIGDILMFTCAIRDFAKAFPEVEMQVQSTAMHLWDYNPHINRDKWEGIIDGKDNIQDAIESAIKQDKPVKLYIGAKKGTNASNRSDNHFANAYRISMEDVLGVSIPQGPIRPDIYMTQSEYDSPPIVEPPYWLITAGEKGDWTAKTYPFNRWQEVVERMSGITFVQLGSPGHKHPELTGRNVVNLIGKTEDRQTGIRELFNLFLNCEGSMGLVSFQMHLAAAFNKPCIVLAGAREPVWFTRYPGQQYLATDGCLPCTVTDKDEPKACWYCKIERCPYLVEHEEQKVPLCADLISTDDIIASIERYQDGGRLDKYGKSEKSKLVTIIPDSSDTHHIGTGIPHTTDSLDLLNQLWGFSWGGGSITDRDWEFLSRVCKENSVKTVLEFGTGLSTLLFNDFGCRTTSYETKQSWIDKVKDINPTLTMGLWDGVSDIESAKYDLAFVDGPAGGESREHSIRIASDMADLVVVHDAGRAPEQKWQEMFLTEDFEMMEKGGHRCKFWKRKEYDFAEVEEEPCRIEVSPEWKLAKIVFNGRGEGGAERSTTWIMNKLINQGWQVQYIAPRGASGTFRKEGHKDVEIFAELEEISKPCDLLLLYTNDWIWDFKKPEVIEAFSNLQAKRKVMTVNFRMGEIGKLEWTKNWDKYLFLNSSLESQLRERIATDDTIAMAPPTDLSQFFETDISYNGNLRIVRHSSQGDNKYAKDFNDKIKRILEEIPGSEIHLMPAPSFLDDFGERVVTYKRNHPPVNEFLALGNCFWYSLPDGYHDQGPKVIMEAQASGLPIVADNHSGARDRVAKGTGYLCDNFEDHIALLTICDDQKMRRELGENAREHAKATYRPERWIKEITG